MDDPDGNPGDWQHTLGNEFFQSPFSLCTTALHLHSLGLLTVSRDANISQSKVRLYCKWFLLFTLHITIIDSFIIYEVRLISGHFIQRRYLFTHYLHNCTSNLEIIHLHLLDTYASLHLHYHYDLSISLQLGFS